MSAKSIIGTMISASLVALLLCPQNAFAYLDPGTGSYVLQLVLGALFAGLFTMKLWWARFKQITRKALRSLRTLL
jgi:hypothetical protein